MAELDPRAIVCTEMGKAPLARRADFLRELMAASAAQLRMMVGDAEASEAVFRLGDALVTGGRIDGR